MKEWGIHVNFIIGRSWKRFGLSYTDCVCDIRVLYCGFSSRRTKLVFVVSDARGRRLCTCIHTVTVA